MKCPQCRDGLSARLDGEESPAERAALDHHMAGCADCRRWFDRAAHLTRLARTGPVEPVPDLVDAVLAAAPRPRRVRWETVARALLAVVGVAQLGLAIGGVLAAAHGGHGGAGLGGATLVHFSHESSAWNVALGLGFLWVAARSERARALVPLVAGFVVVLAALSVPDLLNGRVDASRLTSHLVVVAGLVALLVLTRLDPRPGTGTPITGSDVPAPAVAGPAPATGPDDRPGPGDDQGLQPTARHHAA